MIGISSNTKYKVWPLLQVLYYYEKYLYSKACVPRNIALTIYSEENFVVKKNIRQDSCHLILALIAKYIYIKLFFFYQVFKSHHFLFFTNHAQMPLQKHNKIQVKNIY